MAPLPSSAVVGVVGAGTMGSGIAQVAAAAGHAVLLFDSQSGATERGIAAIRAALARVVERKRMTEDEAEALLARIRPAASLDALKPAALVVEAIVEDMATKKALFTALEALLAEDAILATNTSSLSITEMAGSLKHPERVVGLHFFNPAPIMPLVEVISGFATAPAVADTAFETALAWGKTPVRVKSTPGFLGNRVARPYYGEALRSLEEDVADVPTYDAIMREAAGFRMGPFELLDLVGIDVNWAVTNSVHDAYFHDPRYKPFRIQGEMVAAGRLGRKTKLGFYDHREGAPEEGLWMCTVCAWRASMRACSGLGGGVASSATGAMDAPGSMTAGTSTSLPRSFFDSTAAALTASRCAGFANFLPLPPSPPLARRASQASRIRAACRARASGDHAPITTSFFGSVGFCARRPRLAGRSTSDRSASPDSSRKLSSSGSRSNAAPSRSCPASASSSSPNRSTARLSGAGPRPSIFRPVGSNRVPHDIHFFHSSTWSGASPIASKIERPPHFGQVITPLAPSQTRSFRPLAAPAKAAQSATTTTRTTTDTPGTANRATSHTPPGYGHAPGR